MVLAYHPIFCTYGHWLPNDPRGSASRYVGSRSLLRFGEAGWHDPRGENPETPHNLAIREAAKARLKYPPVRLTDDQIRSVAAGFGATIAQDRTTVYACALLAEHVHVVVARDGRRIEEIVDRLKLAAAQRLDADLRHPFWRLPRIDGLPPTPWAAGEWKVFLNSAAAIADAIRYVEENPVKEGRGAQRWPFVSRFHVDGVPFRGM